MRQEPRERYLMHEGKSSWGISHEGGQTGDTDDTESEMDSSISPVFTSRQ